MHIEDINLNELFNISMKNPVLQKIFKENKLSKNILNNYQNYSNVENYLKYVDIVCNSNEELDKCLQETKGKKIIISFSLGYFYNSLVDCEHYLGLYKHFSWKRNFIHKNFSPTKFEQDNRKSFLPEYQDVLKATAKILKGGSKKGLMIEISPEVKKDNYFKFLSFRIANSGPNEPLFQKKIIIDNYKSILKMFIESNNNQGNYINQWTIKTCDILFLEDIGDENISIWSRDENLFEILKYRLDNSLLTFVSTNYNKSDLYKIYSSKFDNSKGITKSMSEVRTRKIITYLNQLTDYFEIK
ncbi:hypothetical protein [Spiroplasma endosymbiont of Aspidapion aeneum]|uniref:hypothetical protein n=1 Tax=Spiroplasma endosymbiont of Aspidapion aeneum TaxID=3066276 RepID=UPI00313B93AB